jgi:hypothetical protein
MGVFVFVCLFVCLCVCVCPLCCMCCVCRLGDFLPEVMESFNETFREIPGRLSAEKMKVRPRVYVPVVVVELLFFSSVCLGSVVRLLV